MQEKKYHYEHLVWQHFEKIPLFTSILLNFIAFFKMLYNI